MDGHGWSNRVGTDCYSDDRSMQMFKIEVSYYMPHYSYYNN